MPHIITVRDVAEHVAQRYPHLAPESVVSFARQFMRLLFAKVSQGHEVRIMQAGGKVARPLSVKIYKRNFNVGHANYRAARGASRRRAERQKRAYQRYLKKHFRPDPS